MTITEKQNISALLIHSFNSSTKSKHQQLITRILENEGIKVETFDLPGHSPKQSYPKHTNLNNFYNQTKNHIEKYLKKQEEKIIIASSFGGWTILQYLSQYPKEKEKINKLILIKPLTDIQTTIKFCNLHSQYIEIIKKWEMTKKFSDAIELNQYLKNNEHAKFGTQENPYNLGEIETLIITADKDQIVCNKEFMEKRIKGNKIKYYEHTNSNHRTENILEINNDIRKIKKFIKPQTTNYTKHHHHHNVTWENI